jgi:hypothetical protein
MTVFLAIQVKMSLIACSVAANCLPLQRTLLTMIKQGKK